MGELINTTYCKGCVHYREHWERTTEEGTSFMIFDYDDCELDKCQPFFGSREEWESMK